MHPADGLLVREGVLAAPVWQASIDGGTPTTDEKQDIRIRLSRDILTKEIDWDLTFNVTRR